MSDTNDTSSAALEALQTIITALSRLDASERERVLRSVTTFFGSSTAPVHQREASVPQRSGLRDLDFSGDNAPKPKEFMLEKQPRTDVERIACLAYEMSP
jgi:hypothetical protein